MRPTGLSVYDSVPLGRTCRLSQSYDELVEAMARIEQSAAWLVNLIESETGRTGKNIGREWFASGTILDETQKH
jgi:hypothetical protein